MTLLCKRCWVLLEVRSQSPKLARLGTFQRTSSSSEVSKVSFNPFVPSLPTAVLACWPKAAASNWRKLDCLNPEGYITCRVLHIMFWNLGKWKIGERLQLCKFWVCWVDIFRLITWSCSNTSSGAIDMRHHMLSHFLICTQFICWKIITRIIRFLVKTWFLSAVAAVIVKSKYIQTFWKRNGSFSSHFCSYFTENDQNKGSTIMKDL